MKTDAIFYQLFQTVPDLFFKLIGLSYSKSYKFQSVEIKQTAFRLDGIFVPEQAELPLFFVEVQFQKDERFYGRFFSEIMLYLYQQQPKQTAWQAVAIFPNRKTDNGYLTHYEPLTSRLQRIYLDEILPLSEPSELNLLAIPFVNDNKAVEIAKDLLQESDDSPEKQVKLFGLLETLLHYKLPHLSREEIKKMIDISHIDITRTLLYQDAWLAGKVDGKLEGKREGKVEGKLEGLLEGLLQGKQEGNLEGRREEALSIVMRLLTKRFGKFSKTLNKKIMHLSLTELEQLTDDFLGLTSLDDLKHWLANKTKQS